MRKVALITLYDSNIGNRLQNYAVQQILQQHGFQSCTYWYTLKLTAAKKLKSAVKIILGCLFPDIGRALYSGKGKKGLKSSQKNISKKVKRSMYTKRSGLRMNLRIT